MIRADQIPDEAWIAMRDYVAERPYGYDFTEAIAAALNAWPGAQDSGITYGKNSTRIYILPLPQEKPDAEA